MLETAIIGAGLCGLALARGLHRQGRPVAVFEARARLGGRVLSVTGKSAAPLDMGPTWFWPETQPRITRLLQELGLSTFPQHDTGEVLNLVDHDKKPDVMNRPNLHGGAHRVEDGMAALIEALAGELPADNIKLEHVLTDVIDRGNHVLLRFRCGEHTREFAARRVVLAMPPRLVEEKIRFQPPLEAYVRDAMRETCTWMADQAKALVVFDHAFWREQGHSGNAFVHHEHVVLGEIFDACNATGDKAALGGFFSLPAEFRSSLRGGMPMLVSSQLVQVFGPEADDGEQHVQDWANEPYTCSSSDRNLPDHHPAYGHPALRRPQWIEKLHFGGSETASYGGGYLEGALEAAMRVQRNLLQSIPYTRLEATGGHPNEACVERFSHWVETQRQNSVERYRRLLHQNLSQQMKEQLTQRAVLGAMEQVYSEALAVLDGLPFAEIAKDIDQGRCGLTPKVLAPFVGFNKALLDEVISFNRSSCALSNFPDEHRPSPEYLETIARDLAAAWREFAVETNDLLLAKASFKIVATAA